MAECMCCGKRTFGYNFSHHSLKVEEKDLRDLCDATYDGVTLCLGCENDYLDHMREASLKWLREMKVVKEEGNDA